MTTPTVNSELTVEEALRRIQEMFPDTYIAIRRQEYINTNYDGVSIGTEIYIDQGQSPPSCHAKTLSEAIAQVRKWKESQ